MTFDLTDEEAAALLRHLRQAIDYDPSPWAPRLDPFKAILAKLEPPSAAAAEKPPLRSLTPDMAPSHGQRRRRR
jgi:hypothetical protein